MGNTKNIQDVIQEAEENWEMTRLRPDLVQAKRKWCDSTYKVQLSSGEEDSLCGLLCSYPPCDLAKIMRVKPSSLRVSLTRGLYRYVETLIDDRTGKQVKIGFTKVASELEKLSYKKCNNMEPPKEPESNNVQITLKLDLKNLSKQESEAIQAILRQIPGGEKSEIDSIRKGSIEIVLNTTEKGADWLEQLQAIGELEELLGVPVLDVWREKEIVNLSEWVQEAGDLFAGGWQTVKYFLNNLECDPEAYRFSGAVRSGQGEIIASCIKLFELQCSQTSEPIPAIVNLSSEFKQERDILLQVYPCKGERYLIPGLQILVLDAKDKVFLEATAGEADDYIQLRCGAETGDSFSIKLLLDDARVTEYFIF